MSGADQLKDTIAQLAQAGTRPKRGKEPIPQATSAGPPIGSGRGVGIGADSQQSGSGIASPVTETAYEDREFFPEVGITSSDGLFVFYISRAKKVTMRDANNSPVQLVFKEPA
jgi:hypothetical protein